MKRCNACKQWKPLDDFYRVHSGKDEKQTYCKVCTDEKHHQYHLTHLEHEREYTRQYHAAHPEHAERDLEYYRQYYHAHRDELLSSKRQHYTDNLEEEREKARQYRADHHEKYSQYNHRAGLKRKYDLIPEEYATMLASQNGVCAVCGQANIEGRKLGVDHNHQTNKIRGLLCNKCNQVLGLVDEDRDILGALSSYLRDYE